MSGTVIGSLVRLVLSGGERQGADPRVLVREAGLPGWALEDARLRFPTAQMARLWQVSAAHLDDPRFGLRVAAAWRLGACDLSDYIFDTAATLGEAFKLGFEYTPLLNSAGVNDIALTGSGSRGVIRYQIRTPDPAVNTMATEFALGTLLRRARHATGGPVTPLRVQFTGRAPRSHGGLVEAFGTRRIDFGAESSAMTFSSADLGLPLRRADPALASILRGLADARLASPERVPLWIDRFRQVLAECLDDQDMLLSAAARRLHLSPRTVQRFLEREGTSWRSEVDAARRAQATSLEQAGASRAQTAARLGYSDARALRRAARRWERT
jgi:AraC-like DNA-binding protein